MSTNQTKSKTKIPTPLYAVAGVGDYAVQQLRKLPAVVTDLREKAVAGGGELSGRARVGGAGLRERAAAGLKAANQTAVRLRGRAGAAELERLRETALRGATAFVTEAQERATAVYTHLVARGERVVGTGIVHSADAVNADIEATEAPAQVTAAPVDAPAPAKVAVETSATAGPAGGLAEEAEPAAEAKDGRPAGAEPAKDGEPAKAGKAKRTKPVSQV